MSQLQGSLSHDIKSSNHIRSHEAVTKKMPSRRNKLNKKIVLFKKWT